MTVNEIDALVRRGESDTLEFKKTTRQLSRTAETICAFGGVISHSMPGRGASTDYLERFINLLPRTFYHRFQDIWVCYS